MAQITPGIFTPALKAFRLQSNAWSHDKTNNLNLNPIDPCLKPCQKPSSLAEGAWQRKNPETPNPKLTPPRNLESRFCSRHAGFPCTAAFRVYCRWYRDDEARALHVGSESVWTVNCSFRVLSLLYYQMPPEKHRLLANKAFYQAITAVVTIVITITRRRNRY